MKLFDGIKKYLNDNYLGTVECAHCKKTGKAHSFKKTKDGAVICESCYYALPSGNRENLEETSMAEIKEILEYVDYSNRELRPLFQENFTYGYFRADTVHGLIEIQHTIVEMKNLELYLFSFRPTEAKDGLLGSKVKGNVYAKINTVVPSMRFEEIMALDVKAKAKKDWGSNTYVYEYPAKLQEYFDEFNRIVKQFKEANADTSC